MANTKKTTSSKKKKASTKTSTSKKPRKLASSGKSRKTKRRKRTLIKLGKRQKTFLSGLLSGVLIIVLALYVFGVVVPQQKFKNLDLSQTEIVGIDVSRHQGNINWASLEVNPSKKKVNFVIGKATEGATYIDKRYLTNKKNAKQKGYTWGAYHFFSPSSSASKQADNFIKTANLSKGDMVPFLDVEQKGRLSITELQNSVLEWCEIVESHYGVTPIIYCNLDYYKKYFSGLRFRRYLFWIAAYSREPSSQNCVIWQYTEHGSVSGIKGDVDVDIFKGKPIDFQEMILRR